MAVTFSGGGYAGVVINLIQPPPPPSPYYMWSWGLNGDGQLGLGDTTDRSSPVQIGEFGSWSSISAGYSHSMAIG